LQAAGFTYDESLARVLPADYERGAKDSGGADIKPSEVHIETLSTSTVLKLVFQHMSHRIPSPTPILVYPVYVHA